MTHPLRVAYVLLYFPRLTETFVADEIWAVWSHSVDVRIISLLAPGSGPVQPLSQQLLQHTSWAPGVLTSAIWRAQFHYLFKSRRLYLGLLATLLCQPYSKYPVQLFLKRLLIFLKAVSVARSLEDSGIDLLHTHFAWLPGAATWICARLLGKPFTVTVHAYDIYSHKNDLLPLVTREATHVIAISEFNRSQVAAVGMRPANTISVIHCGINLAQFEKQREGQPTSLVGVPLRILSVGSLVPKKGHHRLIAACHILSERGFSFTCRIIGDGPQEQSLREQVRAYGLQHQIELLGARLHPEIIEAYRHHDLFVLASVVAPDGDRDGIPVVLMEAGTMGLPIIATPLSGIPELIQHRVTGWLVPPDDATGLADAIATLAADPGMRRRLGETARALVQDRFDIQRTASQLVAVWQHVCEQSPCSCDAA